VILAQARFMECPIKTSLGALGKKRTILTIRDIWFRKIVRFNLLIQSIQGLTPRVPFNASEATREEGFIECAEEKRSPLRRLTGKGKDTLPI